MSDFHVFAPLEGRSLLTKSVEDAITQAIQSKDLKAGVQLPSELGLCKQFGVSRTVVREALRALSSKGLITIIKGKGVFVKEFSGKSAADPLHFYLKMNFRRSYALDIVHARQILEPAIAEMAAGNRTEDDLRRISENIEDLRSSTADFSELSRIDMQFHIDIAKASGNSLMPLLLEPIHRIIPEIKSSVYATVKDAKESAVVWHKKIFDEVARKNREGARNAMTEHLRIAEEHVEKMLKSTSELE